MKPYRVTVEVTTTYTVEVHAESKHDAHDRALELEFEQWSDGELMQEEITAVSNDIDIEEIQRESGE